MRPATNVVDIGVRVQRFAMARLGYDTNEACLLAHRVLLRAISRESRGSGGEVERAMPTTAQQR
ncbi:MAG: hypothetical protein KJS97_00050 [Alphaproteobacteria bacterium]|nr:hypothetical protein [Alphaproteobacteria bacterium]